MSVFAGLNGYWWFSLLFEIQWTRERGLTLEQNIMFRCYNHFGVQDLVSFLFFKRFYLLSFRKRREGEREGGKHQCVVASRMSPTGDLACNPDVCSDEESNQRPFGLQAGTQSPEPHQPGPILFLKAMQNAKEGRSLRGKEAETSSRDWL